VGESGRERLGGLDHVLVELQPHGLIEPDGGGDLPPVAVDGDEPAVGDRALGDDDLVGEGRHPDRLDVRAELRGPEHRGGQVRPPVIWPADHVVASDLALGDRVAPVLQCQDLVVIQRVREPRGVAGVAGHPPRADGQAGAAQPFGVADRAECHHGHLGVDHAAIG
jgi:hypothetical protein